MKRLAVIAQSRRAYKWIFGPKGDMAFLVKHYMGWGEKRNLCIVGHER